MSTIELKHVTFGFDHQDHLLFENMNVHLDSRWKLGLIGRNGRGKTTFLKLLQNEYHCSGTITSNLLYNYFPQKIKNKDVFTNDILQEHSDVEQWKIEREFHLLGLDSEILYRPFSSLSGGESTKVLLALLFADEDRFHLIDEPTNHLDRAARNQVAEYLKAKKSGYIVVSHDSVFIDEVVDHILAIDKAQVILSKGNYSTYAMQKKIKDQSEIEKNEAIKKEMNRLKKTAREKTEWSNQREKDKYGSPHQKGSGAIMDTGFIGAKSAKMMKRSKSLMNRLENQIAEKELLLKNIEYIEPLTLHYQPSRHQTLITVDHFQLGYEMPLFQPISFEVNRGDCVFIQGANGSGKSSLIEYLKGSFLGESKGNVQTVQNLKISYVRQNFEDNTGTLKQFALEHRISYEELLNNLFKLGLERQVFNTRIEEMSMGQKKRVELAKSLATPSELFIWDEPLNYLDIFNVEQIEHIISEIKPTMLIIEHNQSFIKKIGTKTVELRK